MLQNHENFHVFLLLTTDVFFNKVMQLHARKTIRRVVHGGSEIRRSQPVKVDI